jgi:hypothetical protein
VILFLGLTVLRLLVSSFFQSLMLPRYSVHSHCSLTRETVVLKSSRFVSKSLYSVLGCFNIFSMP